MLIDKFDNTINIDKEYEAPEIDWECQNPENFPNCVNGVY